MRTFTWKIYDDYSFPFTRQIKKDRTDMNNKHYEFLTPEREADFRTFQSMDKHCTLKIQKDLLHCYSYDTILWTWNCANLTTWMHLVKDKPVEQRIPADYKSTAINFQTPSGPYTVAATINDIRCTGYEFQKKDGRTYRSASPFGNGCMEKKDKLLAIFWLPND